MTHQHSLLDLRASGSRLLPDGKCLYIQAGDPSDFDGYLIGYAGIELERHTSDFEFALVVPERRATSNKNGDVNTHEQEFSEEVMATVWNVLSTLCPKANIYRGPLNQRNIIPLKFIFSEHDKYGPLVGGVPHDPKDWKGVKDLANAVERPEVKSVMIDVFGSIGYLDELKRTAPSAFDALGRKLKASNMPVILMAGVAAEVKPTTLAVPGRDPRATMNAIYHKDGVQALLDLASTYNIPLLFVTNNVCNEMLKFEDAEEVVKELGLGGLLADMAKAWYGPHLKGKCVPFDWVSLFAMLCYRRFPDLIQLEERQLLVGKDDASILVLKNVSLELSPEEQEVVGKNEEGTRVWGSVISLVSANKKSMLDLARKMSKRLKAASPQERKQRRIRRVALSLIGGAIALAVALAWKLS